MALSDPVQVPWHHAVEWCDSRGVETEIGKGGSSTLAAGRTSRLGRIASSCMVVGLGGTYQGLEACGLLFSDLSSNTDGGWELFGIVFACS